MYRDKSLLPTQAIRLAVLGSLAAGPRRYGQLAAETRAFTGALVGPSLDLLGTSIELLRFEGLIEPERLAQVELMIDVAEGEVARLEALSQQSAGEPGLLGSWLTLELAQARARLAWFEALKASLTPAINHVEA